MPNIRVDVGFKIKDGSEIKFRSPVDCSAVTGLIVYYPTEDGSIVSNTFAFADAHGNNVGNITNLFAENVVVKVILDVTTSMAFVQNADTNAYLEAQLASKRPNTWLPTIAEIGAAPAGYGLGGAVTTVAHPDEAVETGFYAVNNDAVMPAGHWWVGHVTKYVDGYAVQHFTRLVTGEKIQRFMDNGEWQPWEWENPHLYDGTEYRTTERHNGKPVYVRAIETGELPNNNFKQFTTGINYANIVDFYMLIRRADIKYVYKITQNSDTFWYERTYFTYFPKSDMSQWSGTIFYKYTKD